MLTLYLLIASFSFMMFTAASIAVNLNLDNTEPFFTVSVLILTALWPFSLILLMLVKVVDSYRGWIQSKVNDDILLANLDPSYLNTLDIKKLKLMVFAHDIGAVSINTRTEENIKKSIANKEFEKNFL